MNFNPLNDSGWAVLDDWIENLPAEGQLKCTSKDPYDIKGLRIWVHGRPSDSGRPDNRADSQPSVPISTENPPRNAPQRSQGGRSSLVSPLSNIDINAGGSHRSGGLTRSASMSIVVPAERQFDRLDDDGMKHLALNNDSRLWPNPNYLTGSQPRHNINEIAMNLAQAHGYLTGTAPMNDEELKVYNYKWKMPFKLPLPVLLEDERRGDEIMKGLQTVSETDLRIQRWRAHNYIAHQNYGLGAIVEIKDGSFHPNTIDHCELFALTILLDRQTHWNPNQAKLRAWIVSIKASHFRILEAYLDQRAANNEFHFSIVEEYPYTTGDKKSLDGGDKEWKWLLSWTLAQPL